MGEWSDYPMPDQIATGDIAPAGAGGDPFSDAAPDTATPETFDSGMGPGSSDGEFSPVAGANSFDYSDVLGRTLRGFAGPGFAGGGSPYAGNTYQGLATRQAGAGSILGPYGVTWDTGTAAVRSGGPGVAPNPGNIGVLSPARQVGLIVRSIRQTTMLRVSAKSIVSLIVRYGFPAAAALLKANIGDLVSVFMQAKAVRHRHRGPGLYTIARNLRRADRLRATVRRILGPAVRGAGPGRARHHRRGRKGRR